MTGAVLLAAALNVAPSSRVATAPCAACLHWELDAAQARTLAESGDDLHGLRLILQVPLQEPILRSTAPDETARRLRSRAAIVLLHLPEGREADAAVAESEAVIVGLDPSAAVPLPEQAFRLKTLLTRLRALQPGLRLGLDGPRDRIEGLAGLGLGAYVDFVVVGADEGPVPSMGEAWKRMRLAAPTDLASALQAGGPVVLPWPQGTLGETPRALAAAGGELQASLMALPQVEVACDGEGERAAPSACQASAFLGPEGVVVVLVSPRQPVYAVRLMTASPSSGDDPVAIGALLAPLTAAAPATEVTATASGSTTRLATPGLEAPFILSLRGWGPAQGVFGTGVDVVAQRALTVEEILARHQAAAARQRRLLPTSIASGSLVIAFQAPGLSAPMTVTAEVTLYSGPNGTDVEQRALRLNGASLEGDAVPRLPIVEPERVAVPPLALALGESYHYSLKGVERVSGRDCYRVAFASPTARGTGFQGRAWIDAASFGLVRLSAVQTGLRGPIVSSQQTDEFAPVEHAGTALWMLSRSTVHQTYEGPGFRTAIDRVLAIERQEPDPPDFARRLAAAHASDAVMLRETGRGFQYLRKAPPAAAGALSVPSARVPAGKATAVRTVALGLLVDPNIGDPLPFVGAGYSDFDFLGSGTQLNAFLAGAFVQLSWQAPSLWGSRWRLQLAGQASLIEYNDRVFRDGVEQYGENLRQRPARLATDVSRPLGARWRARIGYDLEYTRLRRSDLTAPAFQEPDSPLAHGLRLGLDGQQGPWSASLWWRPAQRQHWKAWGLAGDPEGRAPRGSYQRFGATVARTLIASPRLLGRIELSGLGGRRLDRFSRYSFDGFENRLTGYPVASVRFDRGLVGHGVLSWRAGKALRLQALADAAHVRDAGFGPGGRTLCGLGAGLEATLPFRALLAVEWGYGPSGRDRDGRRGTQTLRVTAYRLF